MSSSLSSDNRQLANEAYTPACPPYAALFVILLVAAAIPLVNLGQPKLGSPHEARVVVTGQTMAQTGQWVVPYFNGQVRLQKPPLPYWAIGAVARLTGRVDESLFRLPSALMGIAGLLLTLAIARLLFGWQVALMAALIQGLFAKYIIEARLARVDIYLTFWVSVSLLILAIIFFGRRRRDWLWLLLGVSMGVAVLAKWVNVFMFVLPAILYGLAAFRGRRPRWIWLLAGCGALCLVSGSWLALLARELGTDTVLAAWNQEVSDNVASATNRAGHGVLYYIPQLFLITFPFSALTPIMFIIPFMPQLKAERSKLIWTLLVVVSPLIILSLVSKKKIDYLLPAVPAMAILGANVWRIIINEISPQAPETIRNRRSPVAYIQPLIFIVAGIAIGVYSLIQTDLAQPTLIVLSALAFLLCGSIAMAYIIKGRGWPALVAMCVGAAVAWHVVFGFLVPRLTRISSVEFAQAAAEITGDAPLAYYRGRDDTLVYYVKRPITPARNPEELKAFVATHANGFVLVNRKYLEEAQQIAQDIALHDPRFRDVSVPVPGKKDAAFDIYLLSAAPYAQPTRELEADIVAYPDWINAEKLWLIFGFLAQAMFFGRFLIQWIASEKKKESVIPIGFWWLSLAGGLMLFVYSLHRRDPVFIMGQGTGVFIYLRNLYFIYRKKSAGQDRVPNESNDRLEVGPDPADAQS